MPRGIKAKWERKETRNCPVCKEYFVAMRDRISNPFPVYCSRSCRFESKRKRVDVVCKHCGKDFWVHACRADNRRRRGTEAQFCSKACKHAYWRLGNAPLTGTGKPYLSADGYVLVSMPTHPEVIARKGRGVRNNRMREHRIVMEEHLGRVLLPNENVHHKHGDRTDNKIENLELWVKIQPSGQRVSDLIEYVVRYHREAVEACMDKLDQQT